MWANLVFISDVSKANITYSYLICILEIKNTLTPVSARAQGAMVGRKVMGEGEVREDGGETNKTRKKNR